MSRGKKKPQRGTSTGKASPPATLTDRLQASYRRANELAARGDLAEARSLYEEVGRTAMHGGLQALVHNDLAILDAVGGRLDEAVASLRKALVLDPQCQAARDNLTLLEQDIVLHVSQVPTPPPGTRAAPPLKLAVLSFLFNWPSSGGGNVHTTELVRFLAEAGYAVRHFYARFAPWQIGRVTDDSGRSQPIDFDEPSWNVTTIQERFRRAVDAFGPDYVLITDCWNFKPNLARAMRGYPVLLRFQALECLCPLNNVRLLPLGDGRWGQCPRHQLATPGDCADCLKKRGRFSGGLHQAERALAGAGTPEYHALLCESLREAEAVLVLNPLTEAMLSPYAPRVRVVPWGMDPARFPRPDDDALHLERSRKVLFQAGLVDESMKGFAVLHAACERLWRTRQDFELVATGEPAGPVDAFTCYVGWLSQEELPVHYRAADVVVVPTIAQEGLSRTSVEAMAAGRPVVASRIGGLPATVADGATGLLCEPGDPEDLASKLATLLDDSGLRQRLGRAGRQRFEQDFAWPVVIERFYKPLLRTRKG